MISRGLAYFIVFFFFGTIPCAVARDNCQVVKAKGVMNCSGSDKCFLVIYPQTVRQRNVVIQTDSKNYKKYSIWNQMSVEVTAERSESLKLLAHPKLIDGSKLYKEQPFTPLEDRSCGS
jgi:hypothetical protein